ncbi:MAG: phage holin family protein [Saccharofermentans sp.]|nr:phage holin family protein [Saccharofermentans sp.]
MAKVSGVSKKILAKKDMNFFAEFTANAAKAARMLGYGVAAGVLVVFIVLAFIVAFFIRNTLIKQDIKNLEAVLASPDYASLEEQYQKLNDKLNEMTNYSFALTQMRKSVDQVDPAPTDLPEVLAKCIPSDSFIQEYSITNSQLEFSGYTFTYYSPVEMVYLLNQKNVFTARPTISTERANEIEASEKLDPVTKKVTADIINNYYKFEVSGVLVSNVHISFIRYEDVEGSTKTLGGITTETVKAGESYTVEIPSTYTYAGVNYTLTKIYVDDVILEDSSFTDVKNTGNFTDIARKNSEIKLFYAPAQG